MPKAMRKEMLALVDKPLIQYGVEEALAAGIDEIIIITSRGKSAIEDHFDISFELENSLESQYESLVRLSNSLSPPYRTASDDGRGSERDGSRGRRGRSGSSCTRT